MTSITNWRDIYSLSEKNLQSSLHESFIEDCHCPSPAVDSKTMHPPFTEPAEFVLQEKDVFLQLFRDESISAWAFQEDAGHWHPLCPELDAMEFNVSALRTSPREATRLVINSECEDPVPEDTQSDFDWLKTHIESHLGRHAVEDRLVAKYLSIFPSTVLQKVAAFPSRQWEVLAAVGRKPELLDLLETNPALFYLAATRMIDGKHDETLLDVAGKRSRREICGALGLPATASMVRILGKVRPESCSPELLDSLLVSVSDNRRLNLLQHLPRLALSSLLIMAKDFAPRLVTEDFYFEIAEVGPGKCLREALTSFNALRNASPDQLERCLPVPGGMSRIIEAANSIGRLHEPPTPPGKKFTLEEIQAIHAAQDEAGALEFLAGKRSHLPMALEYPPPPFPPPNGSLAITDRGMLVQEAKIQCNCVKEYQDELIAGRCVLFQMLVPERATFEILREGEFWKLGQVKRAGNDPVRDETLSFILTWFNQAMRTLWDASNAKKQCIAVKRRKVDSLIPSAFELR